MDPDRRVREAVTLVFRKFDEIGSVRQVALWFRDERIELPTVAYGPHGRIVEWHLPRYNSVHRLLTNPVYAGAQAQSAPQWPARRCPLPVYRRLDQSRRSDQVHSVWQYAR
jgi:hypothetical protein